MATPAAHAPTPPAAPTAAPATPAPVPVASHPPVSADAVPPVENAAPATDVEDEGHPGIIPPDAKPKDKLDLYSLITKALNDRVEEVLSPAIKRLADKGTEFKHRKVFPEATGHKVVVSVLEGIFKILTQEPEDRTLPMKENTLALPAGFGSVSLLVAGATAKRLPNSPQLLSFGPRWRIRLNPGKTVKEYMAQLPPPPADAPESVDPEEDDAAQAVAPAAPTA